MSQQWPDVAEGDGYTSVPTTNNPGNDFGIIRHNPSVQECKAACNSSDDCKSFAYKKDGTECFLKSTTRPSIDNRDNGLWDTYYKTGNTNVRYKTKPGVVTGNSGSKWYDVAGPYTDPGTCGSSNQSNNCPNGLSELSGKFNTCDETITSKRVFSRTCGFIPKSKNVCPNIGTTDDDLRFVKHDIVTNLDYTNAPWGAAARDPEYYRGASITCGYNRVDKSKWNQLDTWFDATTKANIIRDQCTGPGVTSQELAADSTACGAMMDNSEYNQAILNKLKTEANWFVNPTNCTNFENVVTAKTNDQAVMRVAGELIDSLPVTGWSDGLVTALNSMKGNGNIPLSLKSKIDPKITAYCAASNENTNEKCACRNAAVRGKAKTCQSDIVGCTDVKRYTDLIDRAKTVNQTFGAQMETIYDPNSQSDACQNTKLPTSTILRFGNVGDNKLDVAACFSEFENSGSIGGDVSLKCDIAVKNYESSQSGGGGGGGSSSSSSSSDTKGTFIDGETAGIKNDYWLVVACFICICLMIIGVGLAAVLL